MDCLQAWDAIKQDSTFGGEANTTEAFMRWYGVYPADLTFDFIKANFNPYFYGWPWEVGYTFVMLSEEHFR